MAGLHSARNRERTSISVNYLKRNSVRQAYRLTSFQAVSQLKKTKDTPVRSQF